MKIIKIHSKRLTLQDHSIEDLPEYHSLISDAENMVFLPDLMSHSLDETENTLLQILDDAGRDERKKYYLGIFLKDKTYIGEIGYSVLEKDASGFKRVNLGYFIKKEFWNNGYTSEAVKALIHFAFTENKVNKIETGCLAHNSASENVMIKCGFLKEACKKEHTWFQSKWADRLEYGMTREEYQKLRSGGPR